MDEYFSGLNVNKKTTDEDIGADYSDLVHTGKIYKEPVDETKNEQKASPDIKTVDELNAVSYVERNHDPSLALKSAEEALAISEKINYTKGKGDALANLGFYYLQITEHEKSLELLLKALQLQEQINNES